MKQLKNILRGFLTLALSASLFPCAAQDSTTENHERHHSQIGPTKNYVIMKSWEHQREIYISNGMSEAEADFAIKEDLSFLSIMDRNAGDDLIGLKAPTFKFDEWLNSTPLTLEELKGNVVLVRWFTDTCPYCASSTPALRQLYEEYTDKGLKMIGVFHPKAGRNDPLDIPRVERVVEARGFKFPIAIDWNWSNGALRNWWLTGPKRPGTSVTFILDKSGVIQFIHPGMEYHEDNGSELHAMCSNDMGRIKAAIERLIAQ